MAKIIDFNSFKAKHPKHINTKFDDIDDLDEFDTWYDDLNLRKVAVVTFLGVTHWIPYGAENTAFEGYLTEEKEYLIMYNDNKDEYYILDDLGEPRRPFDIVPGEYVRL